MTAIFLIVRSRALSAMREKLNGKSTPGAIRIWSTSDKTRPLGSKKSSAKLSYKHKHRLEKLPAEISACETKITALETKLSDPTFFSNNPTEFNEVIAALEQEKASLESYESEWLDLEMLKESLE